MAKEAPIPDADITEENYRRALAYANHMEPEYREQRAAQQELTELFTERLGKDIGRAITLLGKAGPGFAILRKVLKDARKQARG